MIQDKCHRVGWIVLSFVFCLSSAAAADNVLTEQEKAAGWHLLFDGSTTRGWMTPKGQPLPASHVQDGSLNPHPSDYMLVNERQWDDFELSLDFKIRLDPDTGSCEVLTSNESGIWDFRAIASPDGKHIAFCRALTGKSPALHVMDTDGKNIRRLSSGWNDRGADHPKWLAPHDLPQ
jgi:Domain of Unknown Function (DUF1080)